MIPTPRTLRDLLASLPDCDCRSIEKCSRCEALDALLAAEGTQPEKVDVQNAKRQLAEAQSAWGRAIRTERYRDEALPSAAAVDAARDALIAAVERPLLERIEEQTRRADQWQSEFHRLRAEARSAPPTAQRED